MNLRYIKKTWALALTLLMVCSFPLPPLGAASTPIPRVISVSPQGEGVSFDGDNINQQVLPGDLGTRNFAIVTFDYSSSEDYHYYLTHDFDGRPLAAGQNWDFTLQLEADKYDNSNLKIKADLIRLDQSPAVGAEVYSGTYNLQNEEFGAPIGSAQTTVPIRVKFAQAGQYRLTLRAVDANGGAVYSKAVPIVFEVEAQAYPYLITVVPEDTLMTTAGRSNITLKLRKNENYAGNYASPTDAGIRIGLNSSSGVTLNTFDIDYSSIDLAKAVWWGGNNGFALTETVDRTIIISASFANPDSYEISAAVYGRQSAVKYSADNFFRVDVTKAQAYGSELKLADDWLAALMYGFRVESGNGSNLADLEVFEYIQQLRTEDLKDPTGQSKLAEEFVDRYIFKKDNANQRAYLYLPMQELENQKRYTVTVPTGVVTTKEQGYNEVIYWVFDTLSQPTMTWLSQDTVTEEYDPELPLLLRGDNFNFENLTVKFIQADGAQKTYEGEIEAVIYTDSDGNKYIKIYLPRRDRLPVGVYHIQLTNSADYSSMLRYALRVVAAKDYAYTDAGEKIISNDRLGRVLANPDSNLATLELSSRTYRSGRVDVNLDELMGVTTRERQISFPARRGTVMEEVFADSQWGDAAAYNVRSTQSDEEAIVTLNIGRAPLALSSQLKLQLTQVQVVSEFIEVDGLNLAMDGVYVRIPCQIPDFTSVKALRYDQSSRRWEEMGYTPDWVNRQATIYSRNPGIFVLVQGGI